MLISLYIELLFVSIIIYNNKNEFLTISDIIMPFLHNMEFLFTINGILESLKESPFNLTQQIVQVFS